jgi:hypothetical protein
MKKSNTFKKCAIATIVAGSFIAPVHAQNTVSPGFDGFVSGALDLNRTKADANSFGSDQEKSSDTKGELRASVAYTSPMGVGLQLDQVYSSGKYDFDGVGAKVKTTDTAAHLFYRSGNFLIGGFAQQRSYDFGYKVDSDPFDAAEIDIFANGLIKNRTLMGIEGQVFLGDIQIDAQVGRQNQGIRGFSFSDEFYDESIGEDLKGNFGSINANYFINDNWKVGANIGFADWKGDLLDSGDELIRFSASAKNRTQTYGLLTEYRLANSPLSFFAKYQHTTNKLNLAIDGVTIDGLTSTAKENEFGVGIKITFGSGSLRSQATGGASLNPAKVNDNLPLGVYPFALEEFTFAR